MKPCRFFMIAWGAMITLMIASAAHATQIGVVNFVNGSTTPTVIPKNLLTQAKAATAKPGQVVLLRAGASPVGGRAFNFVLSGERAAAIRNALVKAGIPRRKIVSQFVGIVHRGSAAADRQVIVDATTRQALGLATPTGHGQRAALRRLEAQVQGLEAAAHKAAHKPKLKAVPKAQRVRNWVGGAFYLSRTASVNSTTTIPSFTSPTVQSESYGDTYNSTGYGFSLNRRPFSVWGVPVRFGMRGVSQQWQVVNPVLAGTTVASMTPGGALIRPLQARDAVATQFIQADIFTQTNIWGVTVAPGVRVGWMGAQSVSGGETYTPPPAGCTGCIGVTYANLTSTNGSAVRFTPSLKIGYGPVALSYSQSPWGTAGFNAPRVVMGTVNWGRLVHVKAGVAMPDCSAVCQDGSAITNGKILSISAHHWGWGVNITEVLGEKFTQGGEIVPATLAQVMAPFNPQRPWNSYNPGTTITVSKNLTKNVQASLTYGLESESGMGNSAQTNGLGTVQTSSTIKTEELSIRGRF
jgi:outer membrane protein OmpA-like peptidoglycan-associated protein